MRSCNSSTRAPGGETISFSADLQPFVEALAGQAAVALDNRLLLEAQKELLESFIKLIAVAIDRKSPYTSGHCQRIPVLADMLAEAACAATDGPFRDFTLTEEQRYELYMAAWMHGCGKVTTPEYVMDKATKLQTIYDRVETVRTRFAVLMRDAEVAYWRGVAGGGGEAELGKARDAAMAKLEDNLAFVESSNIGGEFMDADKTERIEAMAGLRWRDWTGVDHAVLF